MIITKKSLPRRTVLRGMGATLALPFLDAMVPALSALNKTAAKPASRLGFVYIPNGAVLDSWTPVGEGRAFEFGPTLKPLEPFRDRVLVVSGLGHRNAEAQNDGSGDHARASATWLSGEHPKRTEGIDVRAGTTVDQMAAHELGKETQLRSLEVAVDHLPLVGQCDIGYACTYVNTISWRTPTTPLPMETNPRVVFERLFGDGGSAQERHLQRAQDHSLLDSVTEAAHRLQKTLGASDHQRVNEYLDGVRDLEQRIQKAELAEGTNDMALPPLPVGIPEAFEEHVKLMFDLQVLAFQTDITRVSSFLLSREISIRTYPQIGVPDPHHGMSHHQNDPAAIAKLVKIDTYHVSLLSYFLEKLQSSPDGDGTLLDHSMILYGGCMSNGNKHDHAPLPTVVAGGGAGQLKGGRHLQYPLGTPMSNLLLTLLDKAGVPDMDSFGDSTGRLSGV